MGQGVDAHAGLVNHAPWNAHHGAVGINIAQQHRTSADAGVGSHGDAAQHLGASSHHHVFAQHRVALTALLARAAQGDALVEQAAVAHHGRFANHHAHAVVDEHALADARPGMDFNAGDQSPQLGHQPGDQRQACRPEAMAEPVQAKGMQPGIAEQDLQHAPGSGIAVANDGDVRAQAVQHPQGLGALALLSRPISLQSMSIVLAPR